jgi:hypothetical protein
MKFRNAIFSAVAGLALVASLGGAIAQTISLNYTQRVDADDAVQVIKHGMPTAQSRFATAPQVAAATGYVRTVPLTAFTLSFGAGQQNLLLVPAGTLGTGTVNLAAHPSQGLLNCIRSTQTQTAITIQAGDTPASTVTGAPTALTASTTYCMEYDAVSSTWNLWSVSAG